MRKRKENYYEENPITPYTVHKNHHQHSATDAFCHHLQGQAVLHEFKVSCHPCRKAVGNRFYRGWKTLHAGRVEQFNGRTSVFQNRFQKIAYSSGITGSTAHYVAGKIRSMAHGRWFLAGRSFRKPYAIAIQKAPQFKKALMALPKQHIIILNSFLRETTSEDDFHEMVMICYAVWREARSHREVLARQRIEAFFSQRKAENCTLYNNRRNLSFNQCIGESKWPVSDWLNPRKGEDPCH